MQHVQYVLLFLTLVVNSNRFKFYNVVTCSYSSHPFLCALINLSTLALSCTLLHTLAHSCTLQVNPEEGGGIDWESKVDRLLVMKMIIKMADINTPSKSYDLHRSWTKRITEEFYQQVRLVASLPDFIFLL